MTRVRPDLMKAAVYRRYGGPEVVRIEEVAKPRPKRNEILIRVRATTVSSGDWRARSLAMPQGFGPMAPLVFGVLGPRQPILGSELAGVVEAVGENVTRLRVGDEVVAFPGIAMGGHAEYRTLPQSALIAKKPANLSFEQAAALSFGGVTALRFLRDGAQVLPGEKVLVIGASGAVGSAAIQISRYFGAHVTGVCSVANMDLVKSIGADEVVDYASGSPLDDEYDIICDTVGDASFAAARKALRPGGRLLLVASDLLRTLEAGVKADGKRVISGPGRETIEHIRFLQRLAELGAFKPVIDQVLPLDEIVAAHQRVDTGRKRGSVVIVVANDLKRIPSAGDVDLGHA